MDEPSVAVREFAELVELDGLGYYEYAATRGSILADGSQAILGPGDVDEVDLEPAYEIAVVHHAELPRFLVRLFSELSGSSGAIRVGVQAEYVCDGIEHADLDEAVVFEYVNRVAIMTMAPYVRLAVSDLSQRVFGKTITLGVLRPGDLQFELVQTAIESTADPTVAPPAR